MDTRADPGELLAGLEVSINIKTFSFKPGLQTATRVAKFQWPSL